MGRVQICKLDVRIRWGQPGLGRLHIMRMMTTMLMVMMIFNAMVRWGQPGLSRLIIKLIIVIIMRMMR